MRAALERQLNATWYGESPPGWVLTRLEELYRHFSARARARSQGRRAPDLDAKPIVVVGNLTAGGSGKTPLVIRLCELARECGLQAGVISRGYRRSGGGQLRVTGATPADRAGDEPLLIAQRTGVPVVVDTNREEAARALFANGVDIVISDDGLQRLSLPRMLEFCLIDGKRGFGNGHLLPAGPLREPVSRLDSVDFVLHHVENKAAASRQDGQAMYLSAGKIRQLEGTRTLDLEEVRQSPVAVSAVAGIARPERFFDLLSGKGLESINHAFPDHHRFSKSDFDMAPDGSMILMTEKDAVKCRGMGLPNAWYLPVDAILSQALETTIMQRFREISIASRVI